MPDAESDPPVARTFETFYDQRWVELRRTFGAANFLGLDPEDVVQDTMLIARKHYERFSSDEELVLWCKRVGLNLMHRGTQRAYRRHESPEASPLDSTDASPDLNAVNAEDLAIERVELARVLATLSPRQFMALELDASGRSLDEAAAILGTTAEAARKLRDRAREAARNSWGKMVAAFVLVSARLRRGNQGQSGHTDALLASVVAASVAVALVVPHAPTKAHAAFKRHDFGDVATVPLATHAKPRPTTPATAAFVSSTPRVPRVVLDARSPSASRMRLPHVPTTCAAHVCVGSGCPDKHQAGDSLYLKADGPCGVNATENATPVCEYVIDNPVVGCQRRGSPQWPVDPPAPPSPEGAPL